MVSEQEDYYKETIDSELDYQTDSVHQLIISSI